jgi:hypothetical protein
MNKTRVHVDARHLAALTSGPLTLSLGQSLSVQAHRKVVPGLEPAGTCRVRVVRSRVEIVIDCLIHCNAGSPLPPRRANGIHASLKTPKAYSTVLVYAHPSALLVRLCAAYWLECYTIRKRRTNHKQREAWKSNTRIIKCVLEWTRTNKLQRYHARLLITKNNSE